MKLAYNEDDNTYYVSSARPQSPQRGGWDGDGTPPLTPCLPLCRPHPTGPVLSLICPKSHVFFPLLQAMKVLSKKKLMRQAGFPRKWRKSFRVGDALGTPGARSQPDTPSLPFPQAARRPAGPKLPPRAACSPKGPSNRSTRRSPS